MAYLVGTSSGSEREAGSKKSGWKRDSESSCSKEWRPKLKKMAWRGWKVRVRALLAGELADGRARIWWCRFV